jgi:hypothetical protein
MKVVFTATVVFNDLLPGPKKPGVTFVFSDNLSWQTIDGKPTVGLAGTHSGTHRVLRRAVANDGVLATDTIVWEYEATFVLNAVTHDDKLLDAGQVTARGVWYAKNEQLVDAGGQPTDKRRYAVTGGTGPYRAVRGEGFESANGLTKTLEVDL